MNDQTPGIGDNSQDLTEEQSQALFFHHRRLYKDALAKKKKADADFKNTCKRAKAEKVDPRMIKFSIDLEDDDGTLATEQADRERVAAWMGLSLGGQADMFDRTPAVDRAFDEGKRAGMEGKDCSPPYEPGGEVGQAWLRGWHEGQRVLVSTLDMFKSADAPELIKRESDDHETDDFDDALEEA